MEYSTRENVEQALKAALLKPATPAKKDAPANVKKPEIEITPAMRKNIAQRLRGL